MLYYFQISPVYIPDHTLNVYYNNHSSFVEISFLVFVIHLNKISIKVQKLLGSEWRS